MGLIYTFIFVVIIDVTVTRFSSKPDLIFTLGYWEQSFLFWVIVTLVIAFLSAGVDGILEQMGRR